MRTEAPGGRRDVACLFLRALGTTSVVIAPGGLECLMIDTVLVIGKEHNWRQETARVLQEAGLLAMLSDSGAEAAELWAKVRPALVLLHDGVQEQCFQGLLQKCRESLPAVPWLVVTHFRSAEVHSRLLRQGAFDVLAQPVDKLQLQQIARRALAQMPPVAASPVVAAAAGPAPAPVTATPTATAAVAGELPTIVADAPELIGSSAVMLQLLEQIPQIAASQSTVLLFGESGTGKEVLARTIHRLSPRRERQMLCLNCAALSSSLLESELFGHERGAFTGAEQLRKGRFELADGGTLLLDEISEIEPPLQAKLLRVLQEQQFERVGSSVTQRVDVRVIATTNRDLAACVAAGRFRSDLYYRLNVLPVHLPALKQRRGDIPQLAEHFLRQLAQRQNKPVQSFEAAALALLQQYPWPGNVRELQNICERACVLCLSERIPVQVIAPWLALPPRAADPAVSAANGVVPLAQVEKQEILRALAWFSGNRQRAATALGISVRTLGLKLKKWREQELLPQTAP